MTDPVEPTEKDQTSNTADFSQAIINRTRQRIGFSAIHTQRMVDRILRQVEHSQVWKPDVGSLSPKMVDHFNQALIQRYPSFAKKFAVESPNEPTSEEEELVLPPAGSYGFGGMVYNWSAETSEELPAQVPGLIREPPPSPSEEADMPKQTIVSPPSAQRKAGIRPVSRIEEVHPGASIPKTVQPAPHAPGRSAEFEPPSIETRPDFTDAPISRQVEDTGSTEALEDAGDVPPGAAPSGIAPRSNEPPVAPVLEKPAVQRLQRVADSEPRPPERGSRRWREKIVEISAPAAQNGSEPVSPEEERESDDWSPPSPPVRRLVETEPATPFPDVEKVVGGDVPKAVQRKPERPVTRNVAEHQEVGSEAAPVRRIAAPEPAEFPLRKTGPAEAAPEEQRPAAAAQPLEGTTLPVTRAAEPFIERREQPVVHLQRLESEGLPQPRVLPMSQTPAGQVSEVPLELASPGRSLPDAELPVQRMVEEDAQPGSTSPQRDRAETGQEAAQVRHTVEMEPRARDARTLQQAQERRAGEESGNQLPAGHPAVQRKVDAGNPPEESTPALEMPDVGNSTNKQTARLPQESADSLPLARVQRLFEPPESEHSEPVQPGFQEKPTVEQPQQEPRVAPSIESQPRAVERSVATPEKIQRVAAPTVAEPSLPEAEPSLPEAEPSLPETETPLPGTKQIQSDVSVQRMASAEGLPLASVPGPRLEPHTGVSSVQRDEHFSEEAPLPGESRDTKMPKVGQPNLRQDPGVQESAGHETIVRKPALPPETPEWSQRLVQRDVVSPTDMPGLAEASAQREPRLSIETTAPKPLLSKSEEPAGIQTAGQQPETGAMNQEQPWMPQTPAPEPLPAASAQPPVIQRAELQPSAGPQQPAPEAPPSAAQDSSASHRVAPDRPVIQRSEDSITPPPTREEGALLNSAPQQVLPLARKAVDQVSRREPAAPEAGLVPSEIQLPAPETPQPEISLPSGVAEPIARSSELPLAARLQTRQETGPEAVDRTPAQVQEVRTTIRGMRPLIQDSGMGVTRAARLSPESASISSSEPLAILPQARNELQREPDESSELPAPAADPAPLDAAWAGASPQWEHAAPVSVQRRVRASPLTRPTSGYAAADMPLAASPSANLEMDVLHADDLPGVVTHIQRVMEPATTSQGAPTHAETEKSSAPKPGEVSKEKESASQAELDDLARKIYPLIKRMLAIERERFSG